jgi:hypothetical protein
MIPKQIPVRTRAQIPDRPLSDVLDAPIAARLARFGIVRVADWLKLTPMKRQSFFGVPPSMVNIINAAVAEVVS